MLSCSLFRRHVGAFVDGELDPATSIDFERHLDACPDCQEYAAFEVAYRCEVREALGGVQAPAALSERIRGGLDALDAMQDAPDVEAPVVVEGPWAKVRRVWPSVAAAAAVLVIGAGIAVDNTVDANQASMLEDVVRLHSAALPADVQVEGPISDPPEAVSAYFQGKVEFPVRPASFGHQDVRLVGARLSNVRERRAAALYYRVRGHRFTVVVTDAPVPEVENDVVPTGLRPVGGGQLYYRDVSGYRVPVRRHGGLTYAFTGDLDREELMRLAAEARVTR